MNPIFLATVEQGKLKLEDPQKFREWVGQFIGKTVEVIVRRKTRPRTTGQQDELGNQNGYYFAVVLPMAAKHIGLTIKKAHETFLGAFAPYEVIKLRDKFIHIPIRSSEMNTVQFTEYVESIRQEMAEQGCYIPDPEKVA